MGDMKEVFEALKEDKKERRQKNLENANSYGWEKFSEYHWHKILNGKRIDYYPSSGKFKYDGRWHNGGIEGFMKKNTYKVESDFYSDDELIRNENYRTREINKENK